MFFRFSEANYEKRVHSWQKILLLYTVALRNMLLFYNSVFPVCVTFQLLIFCGTGFEVLTVTVFDYVFLARTIYGKVHIYECSGGPSWSSSQAIGRYWQYALTETCTHKSHYTVL